MSDIYWADAVFQFSKPVIDDRCLQPINIAWNFITLDVSKFERSKVLLFSLVPRFWSEENIEDISSADAVALALVAVSLLAFHVSKPLIDVSFVQSANMLEKFWTFPTFQLETSKLFNCLQPSNI